MTQKNGPDCSGPSVHGRDCLSSMAMAAMTSVVAARPGVALSAMARPDAVVVSLIGICRSSEAKECRHFVSPAGEQITRQRAQREGCVAPSLFARLSSDWGDQRSGHYQCGQCTAQETGSGCHDSLLPSLPGRLKHPTKTDSGEHLFRLNDTDPFAFDGVLRFKATQDSMPHRDQSQLSCPRPCLPLCLFLYHPLCLPLSWR